MEIFEDGVICGHAPFFCSRFWLLGVAWCNGLVRETIGYRRPLLESRRREVTKAWMRRFVWSRSLSDRSFTDWPGISAYSYPHPTTPLLDTPRSIAMK
jgi:hypothetical protein